MLIKNIINIDILCMRLFTNNVDHDNTLNNILNYYYYYCYYPLMHRGMGNSFNFNGGKQFSLNVNLLLIQNKAEIKYCSLITALSSALLIKMLGGQLVSHRQT